jgi:6-phosphogluconate dehydrogenase
MEIGMVGLGRMGANMTQRLLRGGHRVVGFDFTPEARRGVEQHGADTVAALEALVAKLAPPRVLWLMVPSGAATESTVNALLLLLKPGDTVVDGGNSNYKDTQRRSLLFADKQLNYVDCGTSGGVWGLAEGGNSVSPRLEDRSRSCPSLGQRWKVSQPGDGEGSQGNH